MKNQHFRHQALQGITMPAKSAPRASQDPLKRSRDDPKRPQEVPRPLQDSSKRPQDHPKRLQDSPMKHQNLAKKLQDRPRSRQDHPKVIFSQLCSIIARSHQEDPRNCQDQHIRSSELLSLHTSEPPGLRVPAANCLGGICEAQTISSSSLENGGGAGLETTNWSA